MLKKLTSLVVILLLLTLPLRGVAGIGMTMPESQSQKVSVSMAQMDHCVGHAAMDHAANGHAADDKPGTSHSQPQPTKCSFCGDCCLGALSLPLTALAASDLHFSAVLIPTFHPLQLGDLPEGPDRPPRRI